MKKRTILEMIVVNLFCKTCGVRVHDWSLVYLKRKPESNLPMEELSGVWRVYIPTGHEEHEVEIRRIRPEETWSETNTKMEDLPW